MIADARARETALDPTRSFAVSAPAGSGKTELLTQRILCLLARVEAPEEIISLTFTRKAAAEMHSRLIAALVRAADDRAPESPHQQKTWELARAALARSDALGWDLPQNPSRLRIRTIDGFCRALSQQLLLEGGSGSQAEPLEYPQTFYRQMLTRVLPRWLEAREARSETLIRLLQHLDNDFEKLADLLTGLLEKRDQWLLHLYKARDARDYLENFLVEIIEENLGRLREKLAPRAGDLALLADYAAGNVRDNPKKASLASCRGLTDLPEASTEHLQQWLGMADLLLTADHKWRKQVTVRDGFPPGGKSGDKALANSRKVLWGDVVDCCKEDPEILDLLKDLRYLPPARYDDNQWLILEALVELLPSLAAQLSVAFQEQNQCDFTEITLAALRALGDEENPTELALRLDYRINHILIDEFQDTSSIQFEILRRLIQGWSPDDGRTLFIVGDGMQSLYGFRNANVGLFLEARAAPVGPIQLEPLDLSVNFRSDGGIIDWVNQVFARAFPTADNIGRGAVRYSPATAFHAGLANAPIGIDVFEDYPDHRAEAERVLELVLDAQARDPDGTIAILVRNRGHLTEILRQLKTAGQTWQATGVDSLSGRMPVIDLLSLTRAMLSPADRIPWLAMLRAPWCGLDNGDLLYLANTVPGEINPRTSQCRFPVLLSQILNHRRIVEISPDGRRILERVAPVIADAWNNRRRKPLRVWLEGLWLGLGGADALASADELTQCRQYFDLLEQYSVAGGIPDWPCFERAVANLYAAPEAAGNPNLQVMTIHKAKGLEFDTVIIPGLNRAGGRNQPQLLLWQESISPAGYSRLVMGPLQETGSDKDPVYRYLQEESGEKNRLENTRVIYVGATRAVKRLHLLFGRKGGKPPSANTLAASLWPWLEQALDGGDPPPYLRVHRFTGPEPEASDEQPETIDSIKRLPPDWTAPKISPGPSTVSTGATGATSESHATAREPADIALESEIASTNPVARHTGTVLHRILRRIVLDGMGRWDRNMIDSLAPHWAVQLRQLGVADTTVPLARLREAVARCLADQTGRWLLDGSHEESACELALQFPDGRDGIRTAVIDRTFIADGKRWIIDYKMARPAENQCLDDFLREQFQRYQTQLQGYAGLFSKTSLEIKTALYFPLVPHLYINEE